MTPEPIEVLVAKVRNLAAWRVVEDDDAITIAVAADLIESQARRIAELEAENAELPKVVADIINAGIDDGTFREALLNVRELQAAKHRIAELEGAAITDAAVERGLCDLFDYCVEELRTCDHQARKRAAKGDNRGFHVHRAKWNTLEHIIGKVVALRSESHRASAEEKA